MSSIKKFSEFVNENLNEGAEGEKIWGDIEKMLKRGNPNSIAPGEFSSGAVFGDILVGVWGEDDDRDYSTINVITTKTDKAKDYMKKFDEMSPMDWSSELDKDGADFVIKSFDYSPDSKPKSVLKAGKSAMAYIKSKL